MKSERLDFVEMTLKDSKEPGIEIEHPNELNKNLPNTTDDVVEDAEDAKSEETADSVSDLMMEVEEKNVGDTIDIATNDDDKSIADASLSAEDVNTDSNQDGNGDSMAVDHVNENQDVEGAIIEEVSSPERSAETESHGNASESVHQESQVKERAEDASPRKSDDVPKDPRRRSKPSFVVPVLPPNMSWGSHTQQASTKNYADVTLPVAHVGATADPRSEGSVSSSTSSRFREKEPIAVSVLPASMSWGSGAHYGNGTTAAALATSPKKPSRFPKGDASVSSSTSSGAYGSERYPRDQQDRHSHVSLSRSPQRDQSRSARRDEPPRSRYDQHPPRFDQRDPWSGHQTSGSPRQDAKSRPPVRHLTTPVRDDQQQRPLMRSQRISRDRQSDSSTPIHPSRAGLVPSIQTHQSVMNQPTSAPVQNSRAQRRPEEQMAYLEEELKRTHRMFDSLPEGSERLGSLRALVRLLTSEIEVLTQVPGVVENDLSRSVSPAAAIDPMMPYSGPEHFLHPQHMHQRELYIPPSTIHSYPSASAYQQPQAPQRISYEALISEDLGQLATPIYWDVTRLSHPPNSSMDTYSGNLRYGGTDLGPFHITLLDERTRKLVDPELILHFHRCITSS